MNIIKSYDELLKAHPHLTIEITYESKVYIEKVNKDHRLQIYKKLNYIFTDPSILIPLKHDLRDLFKYRVGDTRIIIDKVSMTNLIIYLVGHRREIYLILERMRK